MKNSFILFSFFSFLVGCAARPAPHHKIVSKSSHELTYRRADWAHWSDSDGNCLDTRGEILKKRSLIPATMNKKGCKVKNGQWNDYYYPETLHLAAKVDIDHLIPLKHAHDFGAAKWSAKLKESFANDPENLVITNRRYNRQKGAKGIDQWLPINKNYACKYINDWMKIKKKYSLEVGEGEKNTFNLLKSDCRF